MADNYRTRLSNAATELESRRSAEFIRLVQSQTGGMDAKRCGTWATYGWPSSIEPEHLRQLYERQGIAAGVVDLIATRCWDTDPWLVEGDTFDNKKPETRYEATFTAMAQRLDLWSHFATADVRRVVADWSAILLHVADQGRWSDPISGTRRLDKIEPLWRTTLKPTAWDEDPTSRNYGAVTMWQVTIPALAAGGPARTLDVHPDRLFILGNIDEKSSILRAPYNAFINLEKISGGSGESFLKNAARQLHMNFESAGVLQSIAAAYNVKVADLQRVFDKTARDINTGIDNMMTTQGATVTPLVATVPDPQQHYDINMHEVSAATGLSSRMIIGNQTGERSSTEDRQMYNSMRQGRRTRKLSADIRAFLNKLFGLRLLLGPTGEWVIEWDDLTLPTDAERMEKAAKMADINQKMLAVGEPAFDVDEIREAAGYEARSTTDIPPEPDDANRAGDPDQQS